MRRARARITKRRRRLGAREVARWAINGGQIEAFWRSSSIEPRRSRAAFHAFDERGGRRGGDERAERVRTMAIRAARGAVVARAVDGALLLLVSNSRYGGNDVRRVVDDAAELKRAEDCENAHEHEQARGPTSPACRLVERCRHARLAAYGAPASLATTAKNGRGRAAPPGVAQGATTPPAPARMRSTLEMMTP